MISAQRTQKTIQNFSMLLFARGFQILLRLLLIAVLARYLGTKGFGQYGFVISFVELFVIGAQMGLPRVLVREASKHKDQAGSYLGLTDMLVVMTSSVAFLALLVLSVPMASNRETFLAIMVYFASQTVLSVTELRLAIFRAHERMEYQTMIVIIGQLLILGLAMVLVVYDAGLVPLFLGIGVANTVALLLAQFLLRRKFVAATYRVDLPRLWYLARSALPMGVSVLLTVAMWRIGLILLTSMRGDIEAGLAYGPLRVVNDMKIVPISLEASLLPVLASQAASGRESFVVLFEKALKASLVLGLLATVAIVALADPIVLVLFGPEFSPSADALRILGWSTLFTFANVILGSAFVAIDRQVVETSFLLLGVAVSVALSLLLIPRYGFLAACSAIVLGEMTSFLVACLYTWRRRLYPPLPNLICKMAVCVLLAGGVLYAGRGVNPFLLLLGSIASVGISLFVFRAVDRDDVQLLAAIIPK
jgi:O-antigen/teichoic acid export membrane protein